MERKDQCRSRRIRQREGNGLRYITTRHEAEAHNKVFIKKCMVGKLSREIGKTVFFAAQGIIGIVKITAELSRE